MFNKKILLTIATTLLIVFSFAPAQAQTSGAAELKQRISTRIASGERTPVIERIETEALAAAPLQGGLTDILNRQKNALLGCWELTLTFSDGSHVTSTLSVFPGRADGEGTIIHAAEASLLLPNPTTPEQGAWQHNGGLQFIASYSGYAVDDKFQAPFGKIGFRQIITMNSDMESFSGKAKFEVVEGATGMVVFSDTVQVVGKRQRAVAP
ncbi:MAG: hypothetical protein ACRD82_12345 [Blastocatellia bacterium]